MYSSLSTSPTSTSRAPGTLGAPRYLRALRALFPAALVVALLAIACGSDSPEVSVRPIGGSATAAPDASPNATGSATASASAEAVELPFAPTNRVGGGLLVAEYLAGGLADIEGCLPELVNDWELSPVEGDRCALGDIDADGRDELIYVVSVEGDPAPAGDVWFFDDAEGSYRLLTSARALANEILAGVNIEGLVDLTGDGFPEAVISSQTCAGDRCTTGFVIASRHRGLAIEDLAPDDLAAGSREGLTFEDASGDQLTDLVVRREQESDDPTAGPQRGVSLVVSWTGLRFRADEDPDDPAFLIHLVQDADDAYRGGDLVAASDLYLQAAADGALRDWKAEQGERAGRFELAPYSLFRAALAAQRSGDRQGALDLLDRAFSGHQDSVMGLAAGVYLQAFQNGATAGSACQQTEQYLTRLQSVYDEVWDYGFANPTHPITSLCR
jgi:hypothetical protein